ncbi:MAG: glucose-6-phosphate dehydrogenase, partial [Lentisphaerae bacterium]|nr:glucose-6-phosphate dehydrogenase [Lentisphaerota bacterium]
MTQIPNPLPHAPAPCALVIFGASGDLTKRKLLPAIYNLSLLRLLPECLSIVGLARRPLSNAEFRNQMLEGINTFSRKGPADAAAWANFSRRFEYCQGNFDDPNAYQRL